MSTRGVIGRCTGECVMQLHNLSVRVLEVHFEWTNERASESGLAHGRRYGLPYSLPFVVLAFFVASFRLTRLRILCVFFVTFSHTHNGRQILQGCYYSGSSKNG